MEWLWRMLGCVPPSELSGLRLRGDECWVISAPRWDPVVGLAALAGVTGHDGFLYLEGGAHSAEVKAFLATHATPAVERIARGTIWPRQAVHHLPAAAEVFQGLSRLAESHALPEICDHLVLYRPGLVLVDWYDAFARDAYASATLPEAAVRKFAQAVGGSYWSQLD